jgi:hypothetical protein
MFLSMFFSLALAGQAAAGNITCTTLPGISGTLMIQSVTLPQPPPVQLGIFNSMLREGGINELVVFQNCTSTFMNLTQSESLGIEYYYG